MAEQKAKKVNKNPKKAPKDVIVMSVLLIAIFAYIIVECVNATKVDIKTVTAVKSTVYQTVDATALVVRNEHTVQGGSGVTVACLDDGEKINKGGNVAMTFSSSENAEQYSSSVSLQEQLDYYINLESKSAGTATDVESLDSDIAADVNEYVRDCADYSSSSIQQDALDLNEKLTRRQMIIGEDVDFTAVKENIQKQLNAINIDSCKPTGYVTTDESGIFSSYTDGCEGAFDYDKITSIDTATFDKYLKTAKSAKKTDNLGKLVTDYEWYFACKVSADDVKGIEDGDTLDVALKNSDEVLQCEVVSGATLDLGTTESVLVLRCSQMDAEIASMRVEDIEIRYNEYTGFKVPSSAVHIDKDGNKIVYALVANQVEQRTGKIIYTTKDYVVFEYTPDEDNSIRLYDQIITQGKDLYDGKVFS